VEQTATAQKRNDPHIYEKRKNGTLVIITRLSSGFLIFPEELCHKLAASDLNTQYSLSHMIKNMSCILTDSPNTLALLMQSVTFF
jgi:hypothetical protein